MSDIKLTDLADEKRQLRSRLRTRRNEFCTSGASDALAHNFFSEVRIEAGTVVAGYWPIQGEMDSIPIMDLLHMRGHRCGLCVVENCGEPLVFRSWQPGMKLYPGLFGTSIPPESAGRLVPELILVPLLAFDDSGYRLGYGGGFYDVTLATLRASTNSPLAVGLAYEGQEIPSVPHNALDERLDWIVTEVRARHIVGGRV